MASAASTESTLRTESYAVLGLVARLGEATSYDLKREVESSIGRFWSFPHTRLYSEPERLTELGLLSRTQEDSGRRRRFYRLTDQGRAQLRSWLAGGGTAELELRDQGLLKLAFAHELTADELRHLAATQRDFHAARLAGYEAAAEAVDPALRFAYATIEMGRRYGHIAVQFWEDVATMADGGPIPSRTPRQ